MISVILPVYNEEKNIERVINNISDFFYKKSLDFEIVAVNDGSKDQTADVLAYYRNNPQIHIISHKQNLGCGATMRSGLKATKGDLIFYTDADNQFAIEDIVPFLQQIQNYDFIVGYRNPRQDSLIRIIYGIAFRVVARLFFSVRVKDINCAFKLYNARIIKSLSLQEDVKLFNLEMFALANKKGYKFLELPVRHFPRTVGRQTGGSVGIVVYAMWHIFGLWKRIRFLKKIN